MPYRSRKRLDSWSGDDGVHGHGVRRRSCASTGANVTSAERNVPTSYSRRLVASATAGLAGAPGSIRVARSTVASRVLSTPVVRTRAHDVARALADGDGDVHAALARVHRRPQIHRDVPVAEVAVVALERDSRRLLAPGDVGAADREAGRRCGLCLRPRGPRRSP